MAGVIPTHLVPVDCKRLQLGMYVAELDRPWLQTPFHAHGFMLSHAEQIESLRRVCSYVYVDPVLSEHSENGLFSTGLTERVSTLVAGNHLSSLDRSRHALHETSHTLDATVRDARRAEQITLAATQIGPQGTGQQYHR